MTLPQRPVHPGRTPHQGAARRLSRVLAVTAAAATAVAITAGAAAHAAPVQDRATVKARVDQLYSEAEQASERSSAAEEDAKRLQREANDLQAAVARDQAAVTDTRTGLAEIAAAQYRSGGMDPAVQLMLSSDPAGYLAEARTLGQAGEQRADSLRLLQRQQHTLDQRRAETTAKLGALEKVRTALNQDRQQVQARLKSAQDLLNGLDAAARAQLAAQDEHEAEQRATRGTDRLDLGVAPPASDRAGVAVAAALSRLGTPYVYGSTGPDTFDCSGLMYWSWRQAGVTLPRTSQEQAFGGQRISLAEARPGDLVIFFNDMHHVGMYVGGGTVIHAPHPGARVRYESVSAMPVAAVVRV